MSRSFALLASALVLGACVSLEPLPAGTGSDGRPFDADEATVVLPASERLTYDGTWNGISAGEGVITFAREGDRYESTASVETTGALALFRSLNVRLESTAGATDFVSRRWRFVHEGEKEVDVEFDADSSRIRSVIRRGEEEDRIEAKSEVAMEPLGAILALRRSPLPPGIVYTTELFMEKHLYRADLLVSDAHTVDVDAGEYRCRLVRAAIRRIRDGQAEEEGRPAAIWLTDDPARIPVRIVVDTNIGQIRLDLTGYQAETTP